MLKRRKPARHKLTASSWRSMHSICRDQREPNYGNYTARGIVVCERWNNYDNFVLDMGQRPSREFVIDRIDKSKGFSPDNCRWATRKTQQQNTRGTRQITLNGVTRCLSAWSRFTGLDCTTIWNRLHAGESVEKALLTPGGIRGRRPKEKPATQIL